MNNISELYNDDYVISDAGQAERIIKEIKARAQEDQEMIRWHLDQAAAIQARMEGEMQRLKMLLLPYFETIPHHITKGGQQKAQLPSATLIMKPSKVDYQRDDAVLLAYSKEHKPEAVKVKETVDWAMWKQAIKETGVIPEGVTPVEVPEEFEVKIDV